MEPESEQALEKRIPGRLVQTMAVTKDCMVLSYLPQWNHGLGDNLGVADNSAGGVRTLVHWDEGDNDTAANPDYRFLLAIYSRKTTVGDSPGRILVREVSEEWPERSSWESQPAVHSDQIVSTQSFESDDGWKLFDVTAVVRRQINFSEPTFGVVLQFDTEQPAMPPTDQARFLQRERRWSGYAFVSREGAGKWQRCRPVLLVVEE